MVAAYMVMPKLVVLRPVYIWDFLQDCTIFKTSKIKPRHLVRFYLNRK